MTVQELYYELHLLVNKNNEDVKINIEKLHFVTIFNRELDKWLNESLILNNNSSKITYLQELLIPNEKLELLEDRKEYSSYTLPNNFFSVATVYAICKNEICSKNIFAYEINPKEKNVFLQDEFSKPSFEWEESIFTISQNKLFFYKENFKILDCIISYYSNDFKIDIEGYINLQDKPSENINCKLSDFYQREILNRVALEISRQFEDINKFQLSKTRIN